MATKQTLFAISRTRLVVAKGQNNVDKCSSLCADACASLFLWQLLGVVAVANPVASMPGDHCAACARSGLQARRAPMLERTWVQVIHRPR